MSKKTSSVRTPIWADQPQYDLRQIELNSENLRILATLGSVLAAKLNVTPPGFQSYLNVAAAAALLPDDAAHADLPSVLTYLDRACAEQGIGITISVRGTER